MKKLTLSILILAVFCSCTQNDVPKIYEGDSRMAILDNMLTRRSIRKYTTQQVRKGQIDTIMKYSLYAPSAMNKQPWQIRVVQNKQMLEEITKRYYNYAQQQMNQGQTLIGNSGRINDKGFSIFHNSPSLIIVARDKNNPYSTLDCGIILQNILLSAHAIGLGTCPLALIVPTFNVPENRDLLDAMNISEDYEVAVCISLGFPAESPTMKERFPDRIKIIE